MDIDDDWTLTSVARPRHRQRVRFVVSALGNVTHEGAFYDYVEKRLWKLGKSPEGASWFFKSDEDGKRYREGVFRWQPRRRATSAKTS